MYYQYSFFVVAVFCLCGVFCDGMTLEAFFGQVFLVAGPVVAVFCTVCAVDPRLVIFTVGGGFWWAFSALISSVFWYIVAPMQMYPAFGIGFAVLFQELARWGFVALVRCVFSLFFYCDVDHDVFLCCFLFAVGSKNV